MPPFAVIKLKLEAEVAGFLFDDVIQFAASWAMNTIPSASLLVAVGRRVDTGEPATIHRAIASLKQQEPIEVFLTATVTSIENAVAAFPTRRRIKIFDGKIVGTGWRRTSESAHFTINILHWMGDINYASAISASSHPGNPSDFTYPAAYRLIGPKFARGAGGANTLSWIPMVDPALVADFAGDLWTNTLKPWMQAVADDDPFEVNLFGGQAGEGDENTKAAIKRMTIDRDVPLEVDLRGANNEVIRHALSQALTNETGGNWINTTLWGKLIGDWAPAYRFSVIPRIDDCLIVPFTGGLQGDPWVTILSADYNHASLNAQLHQVLRAVGIMHPVMSGSGYDLNRGSSKLDRGGCAGWFQPNEHGKGIVLLKDAPKWLADASVPFVFTSSSQGIEGKPIGTGVDEMIEDDGDNPVHDVAASQEAHKGILNAYAHQWYAMEALKGRIGELSGKLRFDICPGSNIKIEARAARNISQDELVEDIFATVMQVSYLINAESQKAGTAYTLTHIRTVAENESDITSIAGPPLYMKKWVGNVLSSEVLPGE